MVNPESVIGLVAKIDGRIVGRVTHACQGEVGIEYVLEVEEDAFKRYGGRLPAYSLCDADPVTGVKK